MDFEISSVFSPTGDQPDAIAALTEGINSGVPFQTLLGVTGSGKTFTIANVVVPLLFARRKAAKESAVSPD